MNSHIIIRATLACIGVACLSSASAALAQPLKPSPQIIAPPAPEFRVLRSDEQTVIIEYRPAYRPLNTIHGSGNEVFQLQDFGGAIGSDLPDDAGSPDLRYRLLPLAFPGRTGNNVQILSADYEDVSGVLYAPIRAVKLKDKMLESMPPSVRPERYAENRFLTGSIVQLSPIRQSRSLLLGTVRVSPVQYNPVTKAMRRYTRMVIQVIFGPSEGRRVRDRRDDRLYSQTLLNASAAVSWRAGDAGPTRAPGVSSVLANGTWYRIPISSDGLYILDANYLSKTGIDISHLDPRTIRIFGNGGGELPEPAASPRPIDLVENSIYVSAQNDTAFTAGDYVLFYGQSPRGWTYDPASKSYSHYINNYTEVNYYWLNCGMATGKRMQILSSLTTTPTLVPDRYFEHVFVEDERANILGSGKDWLGQSIGEGGSFTYVNALNGLVESDVIRYRYTVASQLGVNATMNVSEGGTQLGSYYLGTANGNYTVVTGNTFSAQGTSTLRPAQSQLNFTYNSDGQSGTGWIDWVEIVYPKTLTASQGSLRFRSSDINAIVEYQLQQWSSSPMVFDVTAPQDVRLFSGVAAAAVQGMYYFRAQQVAGHVSEYYAVVSGSWSQPPAAEPLLKNQNLHGYTDSTDFIIITSQEFRPAADRLAQWRRQPAHGGLHTLVVDVEDIYNEFGGGLPDAVAVRDFLMYTYNSWTVPPQFVLFFGGASYDYKGILGYKSSFVPTWQSPESRDDVFSYSTDDFFVSQYPSFAPYFITGRISSRTSSEADIVESKIERYESASGRDPWKMRMLFVGDDAWTSDETTPAGDYTLFGDQEEVIANPSLTPDELEKVKIYIANYPTVWSAEGRRKPGAYQAIIDDINQGVLLVNYSGHGNPTVWAHERIFQVETTIPQLVNADRLPVYILATCNFSQFDDAKNYTGGELVMNKPDGGGIGLISATRKVFAGDNQNLNVSVQTHLFTRDMFGRVQVERPATALFLAKVGRNTSVNDQKFFYMGDPTMRLQYPGGFASIDSINSQSVDSAGGGSRAYPIPLKSLSKVSVVGTVRRGDNSVDTTFNGQTKIVVNDATTTPTILDYYPGAPPWTYVQTGGVVYRGDNSITNGKFRATFIVPKDISYADTASRGRLVAYCFDPRTIGSNTECVGYTSSIRIAGPDSTVVNTGHGPAIAIYLDSRKFRSGDLVNENPVLLVDLSDSVGINTSSAGIGHRIEAWLNNSPKSIDVTDFYSSKPDDFRQGTVQYQLKDLPQGHNSLSIRAWDSFNNSAMADVNFAVATSDQLTITDVLNYPNPFSSGTSFTMRQNQLGAVRVTVKIYTLAGRMIQSLDYVSGEGESFVRIPWDGRDRDGDILANGVYLYKVAARTIDGRFSTEAIGKLTVMK